MSTMAYATSGWNSDLFSPAALEESAPRPRSHRFDPVMRRRIGPATATPPGSEPDRCEEDVERWDGLS